MDSSKVYFSISKIFEKAILFIYLFVHNFETKQNTKGIMKIIRMVFHNYVFETFENSGSKSKTDFIASISMSKEKEFYCRSNEYELHFMSTNKRDNPVYRVKKYQNDETLWPKL